jgi:hypothetical protein
MAGLRHIVTGLPAVEHFRLTKTRPHQLGAGISWGGYCPKLSKAIEPIKKVLLWACAKNGGERCVMSVGTMQRLLADHHGTPATKRTVNYALKRLVLDGFISRQSRWVKLVDGTIKRARSVTRLKSRLLTEQLARGRRALKLLALGVRPAGEGVVQRIARGYQDLLSNVVPNPLSTGPPGL